MSSMLIISRRQYYCISFLSRTQMIKTDMEVECYLSEARAEELLLWKFRMY